MMAEYAQPAYEDPVDRMLKLGLVPDNFDPSDPKIDDPHERARILKLFDEHSGEPKGFVLPLQRWTAQAKAGWLSEIWRTRRGNLFLMPGDSPLGLRLPLSSLPVLAAADYPHLVPADPFAERLPLSDPRITHPIKPRVVHAARRRGFAAARTGNVGAAAPAGAIAGPPMDRISRCAPRSPSRCATAAYAYSCRRSKPSTIISIWSRPSNRPQPNSICRSISKAMRRHPIRGSTSLK